MSRNLPRMLIPLLVALWLVGGFIFGVYDAVNSLREHEIAMDKYRRSSAKMLPPEDPFGTGAIFATMLFFPLIVAIRVPVSAFEWLSDKAVQVGEKTIKPSDDYKDFKILQLEADVARLEREASV